MKKVEKIVTKKVTIETLAQMVANGFSHLDERFDSVEKDISVLKKNMVEVKQDTSVLKKDIVEVKESIASTRRDVLSMADRFPSNYAFDQLTARVSDLENKSRIKK
jgi:septal ring factor EnvC (AmiA/AmiB activator)